MSDGFDAFIADARAAAQRMRTRSLAQPCFEDVVERARAVDPDAAPPATQPTDSVVDLHAPERGTPDEEAALDEVIAGARAAVARRVAHRRLDGVPAPPAPPEAPPKRRGWMVAGALAMTAAAAVIGLFAMQSTALLEQSEVDSRGEQAARAAPGDRSEGHAEPAPPPRVRETPRAKPKPAATVEVEVEDEPVLVEEPSKPVPPRLSAAERAEKRRSRLAELEKRAQQAWRSGDLAEAKRLFTRVVAEGGRSRQAEMAYADLFALARQGGGGQSKLWRAYLQRFPRGRFADDARAGLCRVAKPDAQAGCWQRYLAAFPKGSYRAEAERAVKP